MLFNCALLYTVFQIIRHYWRQALSPKSMNSSKQMKTFVVQFNHKTLLIKGAFYDTYSLLFKNVSLIWTELRLIGVNQYWQNKESQHDYLYYKG